MERKRFYDAVRTSLFGGKLAQAQVDGLTLILDEAERRKLDPRWTAYILATVLHETARTMRPIEEYGRGKGKPYGVPDPKTGKAYYGRGLVQLTWADNYARMGQLLGVPLYTQPELALRGSYAVQILFEGMIRGMFAKRADGTPHKLADYISGTRCDYREARRIVNVMDKADLIASYAVRFEAALKAAGVAAGAPSPVPAPVPPPPDYAPPESPAATAKDHPMARLIVAIVAALGAAGAAVAKWLGWW